MRHVRLLGKPREQAGLGLGPFVEESVPGLAAAAAYIDAGEFGDEALPSAAFSGGTPKARRDWP